MTFWFTLLKLTLSAPGETFAGALSVNSSDAEAAEVPLGVDFLNRAAGSSTRLGHTTVIRDGIAHIVLTF